MRLTQHLVIVLVLSAQSVLTSSQLVRNYTVNGKTCQMCPPGSYQKSCTECRPCPAGSFTALWNREDTCDRCFGDCRADYHLKVVQNCNSTSNLKCVCENGYRCTERIQNTDNCGYCVKSQARNSTGTDKQTSSSVSSVHSRTSAKPCPFSKCGPQTVPTTPTADTRSSQLAVILCPVVFVVCVALVIQFCIRQSRDGTCFRRAIAKLCNERKQTSASFKSRDSGHQLPRDSYSAKQPPPSLSTANLGPVHVHNPGTVIFSLLSQVTGQVGLATRGGKMADSVGIDVDSGSSDERDTPVCHPASSPSIHLSEEERSGEIDSIFFPSQEQGKECHMSKEEEV